MRNFSKALFSAALVLLCFAVLWAGACLPYYSNTIYYYQDQGVRRELAGQFDLLISSASQGLRAIEPAALDEAMGCSSYSLGAPLQTLYGRRLFLEEELDRNPVKTVILELSYDALSRSYEDHGLEGGIYQLGRSSNISQWADYFLHQIPFRDWPQLLYDTLNRSRYTLKHIYLYGPIKPEQYQTHGFLTGLAAKPMPEASLYEADYHKESLSTAVQPENLADLERCLQLCKDRDIEVILIATPLSEYMLWNCDGFDEILNTHRAIAEKWGLAFYDFNLKKDKLLLYPEDSAYYDQHHLCQNSAPVFSRDLAGVIRLGREGADLSELFYDSYEEAIRERAAQEQEARP